MRCVFVLFILACLEEGSAQTWTRMADFPGIARDDAAAFSINGEIFLGTGMDAGFHLTNDWYKYQFSGDTWTQVASLPSSPRQYCTTFTINNRGYLFGGIDSTGAIAQLWEYDAGNDTWTQRASLPAAGRSACAAFSHGQYGYVCTGMLQGGMPSNEVWRYDATIDQWTARAPVPGVARHRASAFYLSAGYVVGGADNLFQPLSDGYWYESNTDAWSPIAPLPQARFSSDADEGLLACGASSLTQAEDAVWLYGDVGNSWTTFPFPPFGGGPRRGGAMGEYPIPDAGLWFYGTGSDNVQRYNDWWKIEMPVGILEHGIGDRPDLLSNLVSEELAMHLPASFPTVAVRVLDMQGRVIEARSGMTTDHTIDVRGLSPGQYILQIISSHGTFPLPFSVIR